MAKLIVLSFNDLIKDGLEKSYISKTKDITGIKGRLCLGDTVKSGKLIYGRTYCEFDEYGFDSHNNRIIKSCVTLLLRLSDLTIENYYSLRQILNLLESVTDIKFESVKFNQIRLNNFNRNYRFILELCKLISNSLTVSDQTGEIHLSGFIDETLSKDRIYEKFIKNFYSKHLKTAKVSSPRFDWEIGETSDDIFKDRVPELRTDVVIDYPNSRLIIDAKFYAEALKQNYGKFKYRREHLSQLMEYIRSSTKEKSVPTQGMLLYPTVNNEINDSGKIWYLA
jgi:5-methylcytosine-specific restriction enzyme subunit McrC